MKQSRSLGNRKSAAVTIETVLAYSPETRNAFDKLVKKGANQADLQALLCLIPILPDKLAPMVPGKTDRTTTNFPNRIDDLAIEISTVNEKGWLLYNLELDTWLEGDPQQAKRPMSDSAVEPQLGPSRESHGAKNEGRVGESMTLALQSRSLNRATPMSPEGGHNRETLRDFRRLPSLLHAYATYLRLAIRQRKSRDNGRKFAVIKLLEVVRRDTGDFHLPEVTALCQGAFKAAKCPVPKYLSSLDKLYRNNPRLHAPPGKYFSVQRLPAKPADD